MTANKRGRLVAGMAPILALLLVAPEMSLAATAATNTAGACSDPALAAALAAPHRAPDDIARDKYRHPCETLLFFGLRPDMTVVEIWPGKGWYTDILAPYLKPQGAYYAAQFNPASSSAFYRDTRQAFTARMQATPELFGLVQMATFIPDGDESIVAPATADLVITFRNAHNWYMRGGGEARVETAFRKMHDVLKPGGILGVVDHRLPASRPAAVQEDSGYLHQDLVTRIAETVGFKLLAASEVNANPADTADHPDGVWNLPPTLRGAADQRGKYLEIGESDRMTLKFIKPIPRALSPCPARDNCVSSQETRVKYRIDPIRFSGKRDAAHVRLVRVLAMRPDARVVAGDDGYLRVEFRTRWLRFVDDAEFIVGSDRIDMRSASRIGYSDFDKNRERLEEISTAFTRLNRDHKP